MKYKMVLLSLFVFLIVLCSPITHIDAADNNTELAQSEALNQQALARYRQGDINGAISLWEKATHLARSRETGLTQNAEVLNNLGFAYYKLGLKNHDRKLLERASYNLAYAIQVDRGRWVAYLNLADVYMALDRPYEALYGYRQLLNLNPQYAQAEKIRHKIKQLAVLQDKTWNTYAGKGFSLRYPGDYKLGGSGDGGVEISPPKPLANCEPHCPHFLIIKTHHIGEQSLEDWLVKQWRFYGLEHFHLFRISPLKAGGNIDCLERTGLGPGIVAYKTHIWLQAVGERHYYVARHGLVVEFTTAATGLPCADDLPDAWLLRMVLESFHFK